MEYFLYLLWIWKKQFCTLLVGLQNNLRWKVLFQVLLKGNTSNPSVPLGGSAQSQKHMIWKQQTVIGNHVMDENYRKHLWMIRLYSKQHYSTPTEKWWHEWGTLASLSSCPLPSESLLKLPWKLYKSHEFITFLLTLQNVNVLMKAHKLSVITLGKQKSWTVLHTGGLLLLGH